MKSTSTLSTSSPGSLRSYIAGFALSIILTLAAYFIADYHIATAHHGLSHELLTVGILGLAVVQLVVQLLFFLHLGRGSNAKWNILALLFMLLVVFILVFGSLWIMNNLNYNMMSPEQMDAHMRHQSQKGF